MDTIKNNILKDRSLLMDSLLQLIYSEGDRVLNSKLASREDLHDVIEASVKEISAKGEGDFLIDVLSTLHSKLASVKLPGDFKKIAVKKEKPAIKEEPANNVILEEKMETIEGPTEGQKTVIRTIVKKVNKELGKIAYSLGNAGNHEAAYLVERAINTIKQAANKGKLFTK